MVDRFRQNRMFHTYQKHFCSELNQEQERYDDYQSDAEESKKFSARCKMVERFAG